jgi:hypothetical protein
VFEQAVRVRKEIEAGKVGSHQAQHQQDAKPKAILSDCRFDFVGYANQWEDEKD